MGKVGAEKNNDKKPTSNLKKKKKNWKDGTYRVRNENREIRWYRRNREWLIRDTLALNEFIFSKQVSGLESSPHFDIISI